MDKDIRYDIDELCDSAPGGAAIRIIQGQRAPLILAIKSEVEVMGGETVVWNNIFDTVQFQLVTQDNAIIVGCRK